MCGGALFSANSKSYKILLEAFRTSKMRVFVNIGAHGHGALTTTAQLTEGRSVRNQPKQPPAKKKSLRLREIASFQVFAESETRHNSEEEDSHKTQRLRRLQLRSDSKPIKKISKLSLLHGAYPVAIYSGLNSIHEAV